MMASTNHNYILILVHFVFILNLPDRNETGICTWPVPQGALC